jgi:ammonia channel protein AmtB
MDGIRQMDFAGGAVVHFSSGSLTALLPFLLIPLAYLIDRASLRSFLGRLAVGTLLMVCIFQLVTLIYVVSMFG